MENNIDRFDDVFHAYGDDMDEHLDTNIDFDNLYLNVNQNDDDDDNDNGVPMHEEIDQTTNQDLLPVTTIDEQRLSQNLSHLSTDDHVEQTDHDTTRKKRPTSSTRTSKRMKTNSGDNNDNEKEDADDQEKTMSPIFMPKYLSESNLTFDQLINSLLKKTNNNNNQSMIKEQLRTMALLIHNMKENNLNILLWMSYLRSGTGRITQPQTTTTTTTTTSRHAHMLLLWPRDVRTRIIEQGDKNLTDPEQIDHHSCLQYVQKIINDFRQQHYQYEQELNRRRERFGEYWTSDMEDMINKFVEQYGLSSMKMSIEKQIAQIEYYYKDRLIVLDFRAESPNQYQLEIFEKLTQAKITRERSRLDVVILKKRLFYQHLPKTFDSLRIPLPIDLETIDNYSLRQRLSYQCDQILQRTKSEMMLMHIKIAEIKMNQEQERFDRLTNQFKRNQESMTRIDQKLTTIMTGIMKQRFKQLNEHYIALYKLQMDFFVKAPPIMN